MNLSRLCSVLIFSLFAVEAYAGAWTQDRGKGQIILTTLYYATDELYNNQGRSQPQSDYSKYELNPYVEYGLLDGVTIGGNFSIQYAVQESGGAITQTNWGLGDSELFVRLRLLERDGFALSIEPLMKLPSPDSDVPQLGGDDMDAALDISGGYSFSYAGLHHFLGLDAQWRERFGEPENQIRFSATAGIGVTETLTFMPQLFVTLRTKTPDTVTFTQSSGDDYNLYKLQLSLLYRLNDTLTLQGGAFSHLGGRNTGGGGGMMLALWKRF